MDTNLIITIGISTIVAASVSIGTYAVIKNNADKAAACSVRQYEKIQRRIDKLRTELEKPVVTINSK
jgi:prefoldin subunit 5|tara:strand:+ start:1289 stop:1489 length:201 start_codon:yes stop_codon:yes gene_type:complete